MLLGLEFAVPALLNSNAEVETFNDENFSCKTTAIQNRRIDLPSHPTAPLKSRFTSQKLYGKLF